ncbi:hypothetical protein RRG08_008334 [Elysia crispata]|uniref:Uncharacterized protein n=1 Tax=Elysia crispata TaxID=231223 RepID=A0AAE1DTU6_9GAST|nr:hypothetical protein RRG08_008334 [Elysia crispata]
MTPRPNELNMCEASGAVNLSRRAACVRFFANAGQTIPTVVNECLIQWEPPIPPSGSRRAKKLRDVPGAHRNFVPPHHASNDTTRHPHERIPLSAPSSQPAAASCPQHLLQQQQLEQVSLHPNLNQL